MQAGRIECNWISLHNTCPKGYHPSWLGSLCFACKKCDFVTLKWKITTSLNLISFALTYGCQVLSSSQAYALCKAYANQSINSSPLGGAYIYASVNPVSIGSDNRLSPIRCQAIIWTNAGILSIGPLGTNFSEILIESKVNYSRNAKPTWQCPYSTSQELHGLHVVVIVIVYKFTHIHQGHITGTGAITWLPQWLWSNPEHYG